MRIHVLQHVPFEGPAMLSRWAAERGHALTVTHLHAGGSLPAIHTFDRLVVLGGPMGVADTDRYPWLTTEKRFVEHSLASRRAILGICLGAQMLADVLGAVVRPNPHRELGWFPIDIINDLPTPFSALPARLCVMHWHGETFEIPHNCQRMASSEACENQAFVSEVDQVVGLQFHLEWARENAQALIHHCGSDLAPGPYVQSSDQILAATEQFKAAQAHLYSFLDHWVATSAGVEQNLTQLVHRNGGNGVR